MAAWNRLIAPAQTAFRRQRAQRIAAQFPEIQGGTVIDIGGSLAFWRTVEDILKPERILIYNISDGRMRMWMESPSNKIEMHVYDGQNVPHPDGFADVVICNSVIEHVPVEHREGLAREIARVGKRFVVQTPAPEFPLELHFGLPFVHWLPRQIGRKVVRFSPFHLLTHADGPTYFDETQLLPRREFEAYFPGSQIEVERFLGIPKSMLAFG